jgi:hypothetical protein
VVHANAACCVRVRKIQNGAGRNLYCIWGFLIGTKSQGRENQGEEECRATLQAAIEEKKLGLSKKGRWEVLQFVDENSVLVSVTLHVCCDEAISIDKGTDRNTPVSGMQVIRERRLC